MFPIITWNAKQYFYDSSILAQGNSSQWQRKETSSETTQSSTFREKNERAPGKFNYMKILERNYVKFTVILKVIFPEHWNLKQE